MEDTTEQSMLQVPKFLASVRISVRSTGLWLLGLPLLAIGPALLLIVAQDFDGLYGQDSYAYFDYALGPLRENLMALRRPPPFFWPPGYPLLVALTSFLPLAGLQAGQLVSLLGGGLVPVATALLAREVWVGDDPSNGSLVPPLAGLLTALNGQLWQSSMVVMADTLGLAAGTLGMLALARYGRQRQARWLSLAAGALAWAVLTRWGYALVAVPATLYALWLLKCVDKRTALAHGGAALLIAVAILWPLLQPTLAVLFAPPDGAVAFAGSLRFHTWQPQNAFRHEFVTPDGVLRYRLPNGLYYALVPARSFYLTPLLLALAVPGAWSVLRRPRAAALLLLAGWVGIVYTFHAGSPIQNVRFTLAYLPPLAILVAIGAEAVARQAGGRWRGMLVALLLAGLAWMAIGGLLLTHGFVERAQRSKAMIPWVESLVPADAHLLTFGMSLTFEHESRLDVHELYFMGVEEMVAVLRGEGPTYVLLDVANVEAQWQGKPPADNYRWLQASPGLAEIGSRDGYTLFRVDE